MKLSERLAQAQIQDPGAPTAQPAPRSGTAVATQTRPSSAVAARSVARSGSDKVSQLKSDAREELLERIGPRLAGGETLDDDALHNLVRANLGAIVEGSDVPLNPVERRRVIQDVEDDVLGLGPLETLLADDAITEIMVNGADTVYVERGGKLTKSPVRFDDEAHLRQIIERIVSKVGRRIDESSPLVDARLIDGSRVNAIIAPLAVSGSSLTIRKFSRKALGVPDLISFGTITSEMAELLDACVKARLNILVSGGTGTGKTTLLNVLSSFIPHDERIVTIEDAVELQLQQEHLVRLESRPPNVEGKGEISIRDLVKNSLRMRPDRIVVGECRSGEALDMLQAMNTGHDGSLSTVHANSPRDALSRLETLVLMAGMDLPLSAIRKQIASAIDVIIQIERLRDGTRRITAVTEVCGMEQDTVTLQDIFTFDYTPGIDPETGKYRGACVPTTIRPMFFRKFEEYGIQIPARMFGLPDHTDRRW